jgi:hypothetical protein
MTFDLDDVPTWFAFVAAGAAAWRLLQLERGRDAAEAREARRAQAERISGWIDVQTDWQPTQGRFPGRHYARVMIKISNLSDQPVYEVRFTADDLQGCQQSGEIAVLPPRCTREILAGPELVDVDYVLGITGSEFQVQQATRELLQEIRVGISFLDARGRRWIRDGNGQLYGQGLRG